MRRIEIVTLIQATPEACFDLSRDLDLHLESMAHTSERAIAGKTSGLIGLGEQVTWRGRHLGFVFEHTAKITAFDRPRHFRDEMVRGRFKRFVHEHHFEPTGSGTRMLDVIEFESPWGLLGRMVDALVLSAYLTKLLRGRNAVIQQAAESQIAGDRGS